MSNEFPSSFQILYPDITIYISSRQGKLDPALMFPLATPLEILTILQRLIEQELRKLLIITAHLAE